MKYTVLVFSVLLVTVFSCTKDHEDQLALNANLQKLCTLDSSHFTANVLPIVNSNCMPCHSTAQAQGGVTLTNYSDISAWATSGILSHCINQDGSVPAMPQGAAKLNDCYIHAIDLWIQQGALDN